MLNFWFHLPLNQRKAEQESKIDNAAPASSLTIKPPQSIANPL